MKPDASNHNPDPAYLRGLREQVGLSQTALAERLAISRRMIQYYEAAEGEPSHRTAPYLYQFALEMLAIDN
tara:strand:+ start:24208 stop:24420 length:213 start_codon:yes stop_codon:yes gene_type:complete